ncbi:hypothetical protein PRZ48_011292 [Zasmidium cellare]|uniref:S-adenosyl-L-methionine-dependent methyltransferase n=1 Tax=Zasmidium cellare TaxID=395010 RepID=A0ABR0E6Y4_ZASCE|nr:hypothetical protein PRZ48_011292 [Zasmidium cellare]
MAPASLVDLFGETPQEAVNAVYRRNSIGADERAPTYHQDKDAQYVLPNDFQEHVRLEIQALHLSNMMEGHVLHAPIKHSGHQRMLDIGCGTGIITDLMSEKFPQSDCIGLDLSAVPSIREHEPNVSFFQGNAAKDAPSQWKSIHGKADLAKDTELFDYIFSRLLIAGMTDWPAFIRKENELVKPGGWVEIHDLAWDWYDKNDTIISNDWSWLYRLSMVCEEEKGMSFQCGKLAKKWMAEAGFVQIRQFEYRWPFCGNTEETAEMRAFGEYSTTAVPTMIHHMIQRTLDDGSGRGEVKEEVEAMRADMRWCLLPEEGKYQVFYVTIGRKAEE